MMHISCNVQAWVEIMITNTTVLLFNFIEHTSHVIFSIFADLKLVRL